LLGARLVYSKGSMARALSFEYLNRQLVWHELSELLLFLLPLINVGRIKALVMSHLPRISMPDADSVLSGMEDITDLLATVHVYHFGILPDNTRCNSEKKALAGTSSSSIAQQLCALCGASEINVPYSALPCKHRFCYYCLRARTLSDPAYKCPQCGVRITAMRRWRPCLASVQ
jgi:peroxin-2